MRNPPGGVVPIEGLEGLDSGIYRGWIQSSLLIAIAAFGVVTVADAAIPGRRLETAAQSLVLVVTAAGLLLSRAGHLRIAILLPLLMMWAALQSTLPVRGIVGDFGMPALPCLVLASGLAFGSRAAFLLAGVSTVSTSSLVLYAHRVRGVPVEDPQHVMYGLLVLSAAMFATAAVVSVAFRGFSGVLTQARLSGQRLADIIAHAPDGILVLDAAAEVVAANPSALAALGVESRDLLGHDFPSLLRRLDAKGGEEVLGRWAHGDEGEPPAMLGWPASCVTHWVEVTSREFELGRETGRQIMLRDVTDRERAAEEQRIVSERLEEAQRLEAVGRLAGGIAHDFRNLLTVVSTSAELIAEDTEGDARRLAQDIGDASRRATSLTQQLLAFARRGIVQIGRVDIPEVVQFMDVGLRHMLGAGVRLDLRLDDDVPVVMADRSQMEQIVFSLAKNAADAMAGQGNLEIAVVSPGAKSRSRSADTVPLGFVEVSVSDDGPGMTPDTLERAFEPFFTTKPMGEGTGLGLASVHGIVTQNGGHVALESDPGVGMRVVVLWPLVPPPEPGDQRP